jgi:spore coat protein U-like protein
VRRGRLEPRTPVVREGFLPSALRSGALVAVILMSPGAGRVAAAPARVSFLVTASVAPLCSIAVSSLSFGPYDPLLANARAGLDAAATVSVTCTRGTVGKVALDGGANLTSGTDRRMSMGTDRLSYQLYRDPARAAVWEPGGTGVPIVAGGATHGPDRITVYARIFAGQIVPAGVYTDTVRATVEF